MTKVLIVEDETAAANNLQLLLAEMDIEVLDVIESVSECVEWLKSNPAPKLIFMDIHLADDNAFRIFEMTELNSPIIFTTAYDQYAIKAFEVNSIAYILKPIKPLDLKRAIDKFERLSKSEISQYKERMVSTSDNLRGRNTCNFLIPNRDKLIPLSGDDIAFFYTSNEKVAIYTMSGERLAYDKPLDAVMSMLPSDRFFRANRQFIVSRKAIKDLSIWFGSRLNINLSVAVPERIIVSKARTPEIKRWYIGGL